MESSCLDLRPADVYIEKKNEKKKNLKARKFVFTKTPISAGHYGSLPKPSALIFIGKLQTSN